MYDLAMHFLRAGLVAILPLLCSSGLGQESPDKQAKQEPAKRAPSNPTNLKVLKVSTGAEVGQIMRTFTAGLGVQCVYCHVQGNFASDDNPKKDIARHMITMTKQINGNFPESGKMRVSCYTCHRGEAEPKTAPEPKAAQ
jgi:hypothetical protein